MSPAEVITPYFSAVTLVSQLIIADRGEVYSTGSNKFGQLGVGSYLDKSLPVLLESMYSRPVVSISAGEQHSAVLTASGCVYTFGDNRVISTDLKFYSLANLELGIPKNEHFLFTSNVN